MIRKNISYNSIIKAISEIDKNGVPPNRRSSKFHLSYQDKLYPPKYVLSLANKYENGTELSSENFSGGTETNTFLKKLGFEILGCDEISCTKTKKAAVITIITAIIESDELYENISRFQLLENILLNLKGHVDTIILPGGFLKYSRIAIDEIKKIEKQVVDQLKKYKRNIIVCFGIDSTDMKHQLGVAISQKGILSMGRKFYPTDYEDKELLIKKANSIHETEFGHRRVYNWKGKNYFLAICYDSFGIRKLKLPPEDIDLVINLIHGFDQKGQGNSGDVYFSRHGLAGASKQWKCPAFGSAVFFKRMIPMNWPSGVLWNKGKMSTQRWKYKDNPLKPFNIQEITKGSEKTILRYFKINV